VLDNFVDDLETRVAFVIPGDATAVDASMIEIEGVDDVLQELGVVLPSLTLGAQSLTDIDTSGGTTDEIDLGTSGVVNNDHFIGGVAVLYDEGGTNDPQTCNIDDADATSNQISCASPLITAANANDILVILPGVGEELLSGAATATALLDADASGSTTASTLGAIVNDLEDGGRTDLIIDTIAAGVLDAAGVAVLQAMMDNIILCTVDNTNFTPTTTAAQADCVDVDGGAWTPDADQNVGSLIMAISGANTNDRRFAFSTLVDNSELRVTVATPDAWDDAMANGDQFYIIPF
jgi:hypothetical protein